MQSLFPGRQDFLLEVLAAQIAMGEAGGAVPRLLKIIQQDQTNHRAWYLLLDAYRLTGQELERAETCQQMANLFPDDLAPREQLIQLVVDQGLVDQALPLLASHGVAFIQAGQAATVERWYETLLTLSPINERILMGLGELYRQAGDEARHEQTVARLDNLKKLVCPYPPPAAVASAVAGVQPLPAASPATAVAAQEEWEEELDLTELEELEPVEPVAEEAAATYLSDETEVELELELADEWSDEPAGGPTERFDEGFVDLGGELLQEFMDDDAAPATAELPAADKYGLAGLFTAFKKEVDAQIDKADAESHFSLGIAYKEMGLYDDAISEFQVASSSPERRLDSLMLQGLCHREKGAPARAQQLFEEALSLPDLDEDELLNIKYELAVSLEAADRRADARRLYGEIVAVRDDFRDAGERLQSLAS
jgi:tetratricopeptide (TPR) repeat protein